MGYTIGSITRLYAFVQRNTEGFVAEAEGLHDDWGYDKVISRTIAEGENVNIVISGKTYNLERLVAYYAITPTPTSEYPES